MASKKYCGDEFCEKHEDCMDLETETPCVHAHNRYTEEPCKSCDDSCNYEPAQEGGTA